MRAVRVGGAPRLVGKPEGAGRGPMLASLPGTPAERKTVSLKFSGAAEAGDREGRLPTVSGGLPLLDILFVFQKTFFFTMKTFRDR